MVKRATISKHEAYKLAKKAGAKFSQQAGQQTSTTMDKVTALAKLAGYRKPASASGSTGRYFFEHLNKLRIKNGWK